MKKTIGQHSTLTCKAMVDSPGYLLIAFWYSFADRDMFSRFTGIGIGHGKLGGDASGLVIEDGNSSSSSDDDDLEIQASELHEGHGANVKGADNEGGGNVDDKAEGDNNDDNDNDLDDDDDDLDDDDNGDNDDDLGSEGDDFEDENEEGSDGKEV